MEWGLMWFDDTVGRPLVDKVSRAAMHYHRKFGQPPTLCFVHPTAKNGTDQVVVHPLQGEGVQVETLKTIGPNCLWIGVGQASQQQKRSARGASPSGGRKRRKEG
jgi:hypothetical protein